jgi:hypothetical protein
VLKTIAEERKRAEKMMGNANLVVIDVRARDKRHSWNTVK